MKGSNHGLGFDYSRNINSSIDVPPNYCNQGSFPKDNYDDEESFREEHFDHRRVVVNSLVLFVHKSKSKGVDQYYSVTLFELYSFSHVFVFRLDVGDEGYTDAAVLAYQQIKERYFSSDNLIVKEYIK